MSQCAISDLVPRLLGPLEFNPRFCSSHVLSCTDNVVIQVADCESRGGNSLQMYIFVYIEEVTKPISFTQVRIV